MVDVCDRADLEIEQAMKVAVYKSRRDTTVIEPNGECYFCGAAIEHPRRWCDASCRDDWELINK